MSIEHIISREDFAKTYPEGLENYKDYEQARLLGKSGISAEKIAKALGRHPMTIRQWLYKGLKPRCIRGLESICGIIPLSKTSKKVVPIHRLYSWAFWTGSVAKNHTITISSRKENLDMLKQYFKRTLNLTGRITKNAQYDNSYTLTFGKLGKPFGRILQCLEYPTEARKSEHELSVPETIQQTAQLRNEFIRVLFNTRVKQTTNNYWTIHLITTRYLGTARNFGKQTVELIQEAFPLAQLNEKSLHITPARGDKYLPTIKLRREQLARLATHYSEQFVFSPREINYYERKN